MRHFSQTVRRQPHTTLSSERGMCFSLIFCGWMLLSSVFAFDNAAENHTTTLFVDHGQSAKVTCSYRPTNDTEIMTAHLQTLNHTLCYLHMNSWGNPDCKNHIRFMWIKEMEISFELTNLQIQDTGTYTCTVKKVAQPPEEVLGVERVQVIVRPVLSLSCVGSPDGSPMILCSVEWYRDSLEQLWIRDGEILNSSYSHESFNGSFNQKSYLTLPPQTFTDIIYSCWVNHSSLNKPLVANLSSSVCYERGGVTVTVFIVSSVLAVFLISAFMCKCYRRARRRSVPPVGVSVTPEPEMLYSTLGNHHPVPCSPVGVHSSPQ